jgi:hypothetical protein
MTFSKLYSSARELIIQLPSIHGWDASLFIVNYKTLSYLEINFERPLPHIKLTNTSYWHIICRDKKVRAVDNNHPYSSGSDPSHGFGGPSPRTNRYLHDSTAALSLL